MLMIRHRVNTLRELKTVPRYMGIELDLRNEGGRLILQHDPYRTGESFEGLLKKYSHAMMIVNVKSEGLEVEARELLKRYGVRNYFFLDLSWPALVRLVRKGEKNIALRFSEHELMEQCLVFKGKVRWVWIDCFTKIPLNRKSYPALKKYFKLCMVSPELEGHSKQTIQLFRQKLRPYDIDAVCTKYPELWQTS